MVNDRMQTIGYRVYSECILRGNIRWSVGV